MERSSDPISEPIPISMIGSRYLLFDIDVVTYLRRTHNICGSMIGTIPQNPQQNVFLGLPVELMPEEAKLLVEKEIAYIVNDYAWHKTFHTSNGIDRQKYLDSLRETGIKARKVAQQNARNNSKQALARIAQRKAAEASTDEDPPNLDSSVAGRDADSSVPDDVTEPSLFASEGPRAPSTSAFNSEAPYPVTPTTTYYPSSLPQTTENIPDFPVGSSYALYAHLHSLKYFMMPGLRFGCDFNVYPGDPLRFHSHFQATSYDFDQEIPMLDIIGGGRLGTAVKKGFLIGGADTKLEETESGKVRTFCIEWGGM